MEQSTTQSVMTKAPTPASLCPEEFWYSRDEDWGIYFFNDHNNNFGVQVVEMWPKRTQTANGVTLNHEKAWTSIFQELIPTEKQDANGKKALIEPNEFEKMCEGALSRARQFLEIQKMKRDRVKGFMLKKFPQVQKFN